MTANIECEETVDYECEEGEEGEAVNYEREAGEQEQGAEEIAPVGYNRFVQLQTEQMKEYQKGIQSQMEAYHAMMREQMLHQQTMQQQFTHQHKQLLDVLAMSCNARAIPPPLFPPLPPCPLRAEPQPQPKKMPSNLRLTILQDRHHKAAQPELQLKSPLWRAPPWTPEMKAHSKMLKSMLPRRDRAPRRPGKESQRGVLSVDTRAPRKSLKVT